MIAAHLFTGRLIRVAAQACKKQTQSFVPLAFRQGPYL
jgi:hypothetical protein